MRHVGAANRALTLVDSLPWFGEGDRPTKTMNRRLSWPAGLRRWRRWIIALLILIAVRVLLPAILRSVIASQASKAVHARVEVGDVDLALYKLGVVLKDVAVHAASPSADGGAASGAATPAATPGAAAESQAAQAAAGPSEPPLIAWKRFAVSVRWLPLFKKAVILREVELDSPRIALERLPDGKLNLMALVPASSEEAPPPPTPAQTAPTGSGWGVGLDHLVLRDGGVRFRDLKVKDSEPIELTIPTIAVTHVYLIPGQYGQPSKASVTVDVDQGSLQLEATLTQRSATENQLEAYLKARSLPVRRARLYIPKVGWSALEGGLDADITYNFDTGTQNAVRGSATINDFAVRVANLEEPALAWKNLTVKIDPVDLREQRAAVSGVDLNGATLLVRPSGGILLPLLTAAVAGSDSAPDQQNAAPPAAEAATVPPGGAAAAVPAENAPPWRWSVSSVHIGDTRVRLLGPAAPYDIGVGLDLTDLADHAEQPAHIALAVTAGHGSVHVDGGVRVAPPGFGGALKIADLSLPELGAAADAPWKDLLKTARLGSDLTVEAGLAATKDGNALAASDVRVQGKLSLVDVQLTPPSPPGATVGAHAIDLAFDELQVPGVLPAASDVPAIGGGSAALAAGDVHARGKLSVADVNVAVTGPQGYTVGLHALDLGITDLLARGAVPVRGNPPTAPQSGDVQFTGRLQLADLRAARADTTVGVHAIDFAVDELQVPGVLSAAAVPPAGGGSAALAPGDVHARAKLSVADVNVAAPGPQGYTLGLHTLDLGITDLLARGAVPVHGEIPAAIAPSGDVQVGGRLALADLRIAGADAKAFSAGMRAFELPFKEIALPGILSPGAVPGPAKKPMHVTLGDVRLTAPSVRVTRSADGLAVPNFSGAQTPAKAAAPLAATPAAAPAAAPAPLRVAVAVDSFRLADGNVAAIDRTVKPFFEGGFSAINLDVAKLRWPDLTIGNLRFSATGAEKGRIDVYGAIGSDSRWLQVYVDKLGLVPFNPYATAFSAYSIGAGKASIISKVSSAGENYYADNYLTLHNLDVRGGGGESLFKQNFGISLPMALALMRDTEGNIGLDIPISVDQEGTKIGIGTVIRSALQRAILGALTSPLKIVGAAFGSGEKIEAVAPPTIPFLTGRAEFAANGAEEVGQVAALLASRPGIGVTLDTSVTPADVRWLREQALRAEWAGQGMFAKLKDLPDRGARNRVEKALEARARDQEGSLDSEDTKMLDHWLDERPPIPPERLQALAEARLARVEEALRSQHGIEANRIARQSAPADAPASEPPVVRVELGPVSASAAP